MKDQVIVTGGAGFIGSHLCERLVEEGFDVFSLDNYFTGSPDNHVHGVTYIPGNTHEMTTDEFIYTHIPKNPKYVFHLGEYSRVEQSFDDIDLVWEYNTTGIQSILKFCKQSGAKLIYAGSSTKFAEDGANQSPYAFSKASNTNLIKAFSEWFGIKYATVYFYNVFGGREIRHGDYATVVAKFKQAKQDGRKVQIVSPGSQKRNFTYIDDIVDGIIRVAYNGEGDEYGIGNPKSYSIIELAEMFGLEYEMIPERKGNRMGASVIGDKLKALGWEPKTDLETYIKSL